MCRPVRALWGYLMVRIGPVMAADCNLFRKPFVVLIERVKPRFKTI